jgi:hypothetical protein
VSTLAVAIRNQRWEVAALCLLVGVAEAAAALPPDAVEGLLDVLAGLEDERPRKRGGARSPSTGLRTGFGRLPGRTGRTGRGRRR